MSGIRFTEEEVEAHLAKFKGHNRPSLPAADLEPDSRHAATAKDEGQKVHPRVRINIHSKRWRLADPDGLYSKAALDGLTEGGLLPDDSAEYVEAVTYTQEQIPRTQQEETVITVVEVR